jgi:tryptophan synthase alpha chain
MREVGRIASGYVYYVSLKGVTGAGHLDTAAVARCCRASGACERAGGRGLRHPRRRHRAGRGAVADAVVIGSRLVQILEPSRATMRAARRPGLHGRDPRRPSTPDEGVTA